VLKKILIAVFSIFICSNSTYAQYGISLTYAPSKVLKHRKSLLFDVPSLSQEFRLSYTYQTEGNTQWQRFWKEPKLVVNGVFVSFGNDEVLGNAIAILPEIHFTLAKRKSLLLNLQFGTGVAYLNMPFNPNSNPNNNAIGSNLNNITSLKFGLEYKWSSKISSSISTGLVHFSNGLSSSPNAGINIYGASFNVNYVFSENLTVEEEEILTRNPDTLPTYRKWIADIQYNFGFKEHATPGGPKYGVQTISLGAGYRYKEYMTVIAGAEYEYSDAAYNFFKRNFYPEQEAQKLAKKSIVYIENEFRYGAVFNRFRLGFYLNWPFEQTKSNYLKMVTGIYLPSISGYATPYVGVVLKTHTAVADYLGFVGGISF